MEDRIKGSLYGPISLGLLILFGLYLSSLYNYLLFHSLAEIFLLVVAFSIFVITWNSRKVINNNYLLLVGTAYLFIGLTNLFHALAYKGMQIFPGYDADLPTQLWIVGRYLESISFLLAPLFIGGKKLRISRVIVAYSVITALLLVSVFARVFPVCYVEGMGLTPFKKISEYIISLILLGSVLLLWKHRQSFDRTVLRLLMLTGALAIAAELAFTLYVDVYGLFNLIGHFLKIVSAFCLYQALIITGLQRPYDLLFRELTLSNRKLETELGEKSRIEKALRDLNISLEAQVEVRTAELRQRAADLESALGELRKTQDRLVRTERLAAIGELSASVAHELRNPLSAIQASAYYLKSKLTNESNERIRGSLEQIEEQVFHSEKIIHNLLDFARASPLELKPSDINQTMRAAMIEIETCENLKVTTDLAEDLPSVSIDSLQIKQVFLNLLLNAVQAMPKGGQLTARTWTEDRFVVAAVSDTGQGIPLEDQNRIFEPLFTTKVHGTGLGLAISQRIVEAHGGHIKVESQGGAGCTFTVRLPLSQRDILEKPQIKTDDLTGVYG